MKFLIWLFWLFLVVLWNFGFPTVKPIFDVIVAILLSILSIFLNSFLNNKK